MKMCRTLASPEKMPFEEASTISVGYNILYVYDVEPESFDKRSVYKNFDTPFSETERKVLDLWFRQEDWDGYNAPEPNRDSIKNAHQWIMSLYRDIRAPSWIKPHVSSDEEGDVTFEWWKGRKKLTVYVSPDSPETVEYVKVERQDGSSNMESGSMKTHEYRRALWRWLTK